MGLKLAIRLVGLSIAALSTAAVGIYDVNTGGTSTVGSKVYWSI